MLSSPHYGWIKFKPGENAEYDLSYLTDVPNIWLDSAIDGLESMRPFCVTGLLEPGRMICVVGYWNCHVFTEDEDDVEMASEDKDIDHYHFGMLDFCRMLHVDMSSDVDGFANFMYPDAEFAKAIAATLRQKLDNLKELIELREDSFRYDIIC